MGVQTYVVALSEFCKLLVSSYLIGHELPGCRHFFFLIASGSGQGRFSSRHKG